VVWAPHPGSQTLFLTCPHWETLYTGTRGPGKTDALIMDFVQHVGQGWGVDWRGILFRQEYKPLADVIRKSKKWIPKIFPGAKFLASASELKWVFPDGEELLFRVFKRIDDYWDYHGHEYQWIAWEEITAWPNLDGYHMMKSCNRSSRKGIPLKYRATCNPYGPGHNAVKAYFIDPAPPGVPFVAERSSLETLAKDFGLDLRNEGFALRYTVTLHGHYSENTTLMEAQGDYAVSIASSAANPEQAKAWLSDDWDIVAGGMFDDIWGPGKSRILVPPFMPPPGWIITRAYDWGSSKPFSVGWWARANGEAIVLPNGRIFCPPRGSLIRIAEWYGWDGKTPNHGIRMTDTAIGRGIVEREKRLGIWGRVQPGPADSSIFSADPGQVTPAAAMEAVGARFIPADKTSGSRKRGWEIMRRMLASAASDRPEDAGMWIAENCRQWIRCVATLPRSDKDLDDVDTDAEDHNADESRYQALESAPATVTTGTVSA
jgi:hypothetical protein